MKVVDTGQGEREIRCPGVDSIQGDWSWKDKVAEASEKG